MKRVMKSSSLSNNGMTGMSLVELMVTVSMSAILLSTGIPSLQSWNAKRQINAEYREIKEAFRSARDTARADANFPFASICASSDGENCDGADWSDGWIVFGDVNGNGVVGAGDRVVLVQDKLSSGSLIKIEEGAIGSATYTGAITYNDKGYTSALTSFKATDAETLIVTFCNSSLGDDAANYARGVILAPAGIVRNTIDYDGLDGIHEFPEGENLTCPTI